MLLDMQPLRERLNSLFATFRVKSNDYEDLINVLAFIGAELPAHMDDRRSYAPPAIQRKALTSYSKALLLARNALMQIPKERFENEAMEEAAEFPPDVKRSINRDRSTGEITQHITISRVSDNVSANSWQAELDLLDILIRDAEQMTKQTHDLEKPDFYTPILRRAALHCQNAGIKPSASTDSRFYRIAAVLLPCVSDLRPHVKKALLTLNTPK